MDVMYERVAGLDVHKETIVACVRITAGGKVSRECRTFETTTASLEALLGWLTESGCTHVAMEATGVYWKPVWNILSEGKFELMVANAAHIKNVPGRKTDMNDAMWIADLLACGLIRASFVPEQEIQELRSLLRTRKQLTREQTRHVQRIQKTLEEANIKLDSVISDIMGVTGRRMIEAMIGGLRNPFKLAELADRRIKASRKELHDALHGRLTDHHRFRLRLHLRQSDALAEAIGEIDQETQFNRLRGKHGQKKALCAVAASILTAIYHMLKDGTHHQDLGANHFDNRSTEIRAKRLAAQIAKLGFEVELRPMAVAA